jgi:hypothetical protein
MTHTPRYCSVRVALLFSLMVPSVISRLSRLFSATVMLSRPSPFSPNFSSSCAFVGPCEVEYSGVLSQV